MLEWHRAPTHRPAYFADMHGRRLFVQQTRRTMNVPGLAREFEGMMGGIRVADYPSLEKAKTGVELACEARSNAG